MAMQTIGSSSTTRTRAISSRSGGALCFGCPLEPESCCTLVSFLNNRFQLRCFAAAEKRHSFWDARQHQGGLSPKRLTSRDAPPAPVVPLSAVGTRKPWCRSQTRAAWPICKSSSATNIRRIAALLPLIPVLRGRVIDCVDIFKRESVQESYFGCKHDGLSARQGV